MTADPAAPIDHETTYGFAWGPMEVQRAAAFPVGVRELARTIRVVTVYTTTGGKKRARLQICVSPTGKSVRVWRGGKELTEEGKKR